MEQSPDKVKQQNNDVLISALKHLGVEAQASGRNDLVIHDNKKVISIELLKNISHRYLDLHLNSIWEDQMEVAKNIYIMEPC